MQEVRDAVRGGSGKYLTIERDPFCSREDQER